MAAQVDRRTAGGAALLIIDMLNDFDFPEADRIADPARAAAKAIARLRDEADRQGVPAIYINDNYGQWHANAAKLVDHVRDRSALSREIADLLAPRDTDYFVIKPRFSGFYATNLPVLLPQLGADRLILTGVASDICVLFTAGDAHMREYGLWVPEDAVASFAAERTRWALEIMAGSMKAETKGTDVLALGDWLGRE